MKSTRRVMPDRAAKKKVCKLAEEAAATRRVMLDRPEKKWEKFVFSDYHEGKPWMPPSEQIKELESNDQRVPYLCEHCFGIISYYQQIREELLPEEGRSGCFRCKGVFPHYITMRIELRHFKICKTCAQRKKLCQACLVEAKIVPMAKLGKAFLWNGRYRSQGTTANDTADKIPTKILGIRCAKVNVEWNDGTISWEELRGPFGQKHYDMIPPEIIVYSLAPNLCNISSLFSNIFQGIRDSLADVTNVQEIRRFIRRLWDSQQPKTNVSLKRK